MSVRVRSRRRWLLFSVLLMSFPLLAVAVPVSAPAGDLTRGSSASSLTSSALAQKESKTPTDRLDSLKYFHEPGRDDILGHYDTRYFHKVVTYEERTETLVHMIRAYLLTFRKLGLETWIAHGTLLGWWWNGKMLPWDWDVDTQVSGATLNYMAEKLNRTTYDYRDADDKFRRTYILDVNPHARQRDRGDGANIIDARWIDTKNGLYIDITGLSELHPDSQPGIWSCKNFHRYQTTDLYPMRESMYEGVPARIPYAYDKILVEEYKESALVLQEFEGHRWNQDVKEWIKIPKNKLEKQEKKQKG